MTQDNKTATLSGDLLTLGSAKSYRVTPADVTKRLLNRIRVKTEAERQAVIRWLLHAGAEQYVNGGSRLVGDVEVMIDGVSVTSAGVGLASRGESVTSNEHVVTSAGGSVTSAGGSVTPSDTEEKPQRTVLRKHIPPTLPA